MFIITNSPNSRKLTFLEVFFSPLREMVEVYISADAVHRIHLKLIQLLNKSFKYICIDT